MLLNLLNELGKTIRCEAVPKILSVFSDKFNKFNNTRAQMQDSVYHMTLKSHFISNFALKHHISMTILSLPLIQEGQLSITGERMGTKY